MKPKSSLRRRPYGTGGERYPPGDASAFSAEDKIRIVLEGLRGDDSIAALCRKEGIAYGGDGHYGCSQRAQRVIVILSSTRVTPGADLPAEAVRRSRQKIRVRLTVAWP